MIPDLTTHPARLALAAISCALALTSASPGSPPALNHGDRVLWLGDSVTANGTHIALVDAFLMHHFPDTEITFMPCGLASETASGLSEPGHPWPRPNVHERLDRAISKLEPDVAIVCYGVNDGIYHPLSDERFAAFRDGMSRLVGKLKASGARVIALTPIPFDAASFPAGRLMPADAPEFGYQKVFEDYNEVMKHYARWVVSLKNTGAVDLAIDITNPLTDAIAARRRDDPGFKSGDGVHPNAETYALLAEIILRGLGLEDADITSVPEDKRKLALQRHRTLATSYREHVGHKRPGAPRHPMPLDQALERAEALEAQIRGSR